MIAGPNKINGEIEDLANLKTIIGAFEEIAAGRMQKIRQGVLFNREYMDELNHLFQQVNLSYQKQVKKLKPLLARQKNGLTVRVLVSANAGLYGEVVSKTMNLFLADCRKEKSEVVVVGRLGRGLIGKSLPGVKPTFFDFPDREVDNLQTRKMVEFLLPYSRIFVYHGLFKTLLNQEGMAVDLGGEAIYAQLTEPAAREKCYFEPSLIEVLNFFESEIFASLFTHSLHESQLAKFASRMVSLDRAGEKIEEQLGDRIFKRNQLRHRQFNRKQQSALVSRVAYGAL